MTDMLFPTMERDASISDCGKYRWSLSRAWGPFSGRPDWIGWLMLNPSTADANVDDPTIRRCIGFSRDFGGRGLSVRNLFNWRATDPAELRTTPNPIGPANHIDACDRLIVEMFECCAVVIAAWGTKGGLHGRDRHVYDVIARAGLLHRLFCLRMTQDGHPEHPLYLPKTLRPIPFRMPAPTNNPKLEGEPRE